MRTTIAKGGGLREWVKQNWVILQTKNRMAL